MGLDTGNISQLDFMIRNSLKMKTYPFCAKFSKHVLQSMWGLGGAKKNNKQREKERKKEGRRGRKAKARKKKKAEKDRVMK